MTKVSLNLVFGISTDISKYTYVDRQNLDAQFNYYYESQKHLVVYGASKQGKSSLRKKNISDDQSLIIQCLPEMDNIDEIWKTALQKAGLEITQKNEVSSTEENINSDSVDGSLQIPFAKVGADTSSSISSMATEKTESVPVQTRSLLPSLTDHLTKTGQRLILEDFHYLPDETRKGIAFALKAFYEVKAYVIIVGIWSEQNLLTYYNGDLTGRIEEINLSWTDGDLLKVLSQGEGVLNVEFAPGLKTQLINSTFGNVGLLQRLAEKICIEEGIFSTVDEKYIIANIETLKKAQHEVINDIRQRYARISEVFKDSMRSDSKLLMYARIYNELIRATDAELINGISYTTLFERIMQNSNGVTCRQGDLTAALDRVERLQAQKGVTPLLVSYSKATRTLFLIDREFMFYRKFSGDSTDELLIDTNDENTSPLI